MGKPVAFYRTYANAGKQALNFSLRLGLPASVGLPAWRWRSPPCAPFLGLSPSFQGAGGLPPLVGWRRLATG